jgi:hypothetical protein
MSSDTIAAVPASRVTSTTPNAKNSITDIGPPRWGQRDDIGAFMKKA